MSVLTIKRVSVLPAEPAANTTYLIAVAGGDDLQVAVTNGDGSVVKKSLLRADIATMINSAITKTEGGAVDAIAAALAEAKSYTDSGLTAEVTRSNAYADQAEADAIAAAGTAASAALAIETAARNAGDDMAVTKAKHYTDTSIAAEVARSNAYADQAEADAIAAAGTAASAALAIETAARIAGDGDAVKAAAIYTDSKVSSEAANRVSGDDMAVAKAKHYTDTSIAAEVARSNAYADNAVSAGIAALDLSATVQYADNIAGRDTLAAGLTKSSLIFVVDATGDATVSAGSALYFYDLPTLEFTKVSEYESLDLAIPNKSILESFSVDQGRLAYNGALVSTVDFDAAGSTW